MNKFNSLSEAIRAGCQLAEKGVKEFGQLDVDGRPRTCALGAAWHAIFGVPPVKVDGVLPMNGVAVTTDVEGALGISTDGRIPYPNNPEINDPVFVVVYNMNDGPGSPLNPIDREYTREEIADYVEKFQDILKVG